MTRLDRSDSKNLRRNLDVGITEARDSVKLIITEVNKSGTKDLVLTLKQVDDLIVMLTYYKKVVEDAL